MFGNLFRTRARGLAAGCAVSLIGLAGIAGPASAANKFAAVTSVTSLTTASASSCTMPALSQPFLQFGDTAEYALVPGEVFDGFDATGWTLSGGAAVTSTTLQDGTTGSVLNLPAGATAVSPPMCVDSDFPNARTMIRQVSGTQAVQLNAQYAGSSPTVAGRFSPTASSGWTPSNPVQTHPGSAAGWQLVVFTLQASSAAGLDQVYNFYVDPRMSH